VHEFARVVLAYHGCVEPLGARLLAGRVSITAWPWSRNQWDWLGHGIYFWEYAPSRALRWAEAKARRTGGAPSVIGAVVQLGRCLDLTDIANTESLAIAYQQVRAAYEAAGRELPRNRGSMPDLKRRELDCLVLNYLCSQSPVLYQTVRGVFLEGDPAYPDAMIRKESHVQIAVRDPSCILGVFRPNLG
jgi:hypothetical protein